jgi:hypothetical protein
LITLCLFYNIHFNVFPSTPGSPGSSLQIVSQKFCAQFLRLAYNANYQYPHYAVYIGPKIDSFQVRNSRDSAVGIATGYGLDRRGFGVRVTVKARFLSSSRHPDWLSGPPSLPSNGYRV